MGSGMKLIYTAIAMAALLVLAGFVGFFASLHR